MKIRYFSILIFMSLLISGCNNAPEPKKQLGEIYSVALDAIMEQDEELNSGMEFIAINMSMLEEVDESDKEAVLSYFKKKYEVDVDMTEATVQELKETELYDSNTSSLKGVFLSLDKVEFKDNNNVVFEGSKFRSNTEGFVVQVTVHYKDNTWQSKEVKTFLELGDLLN
ncbi:hypothetical protein [Bacillus niameyensis]|uniref:hypothetical protein n=1 Tax=Bacillus niameyensis TaxID=1522308 RepID=UPI000785D9F3|nr:hypothetical protein [Bacillus niameyensis]